jgi:hypothetical protein
MLILLALLIIGGTMSQYVYLKHKEFIVQCKLEEEGVVLDIFEGDEVVDSTYKYYQEMGLKPPKVDPEL